MELRLIFGILRRRWLVVLAPTLVVAAFALTQVTAPAASYSVGLRFTAGQRSGLVESPNFDPNFFRWQTSEYIVAGLRDWVRSAAFASALSEELAVRSLAIPPEALLGRIGADSSQSLLAVYVQWGDPDQLMAISQAVVTVLQTRNGEAFPQLGSQPAEVVPMDTPEILPVIETLGVSLRDRLQLPFRVALGLAGGLALAFLADYLDPSVRDGRELEEMGLRVIAEIPKTKRIAANRGRRASSRRP